MLTPIYLTDDDGNKIEQTSGSGDYIIIGYIDSALFADTSGELRNTFLGIVQAASAEEKAEVLRGLRLAKSIRGRLNRFELSGTSDNAYVKYNHSIFGGRFQSQFTALGAIAGTYLRRGGSAFTKELVETALVSGPYANFSNFPSSPVLPGDTTFSVAAGGGTEITYSWSITDSSNAAVAIADPTASAVTVNLSPDTYTVSCTVGIDGTPIVLGDTLEVAVFSASSLGADVNNPSTGDRVVISYQGTSNPSLLDATDWTVERFTDWRTVPLGDTITGSIDLPALEDVDYSVVSETAEQLTIQFLTGGTFRVSATARHSDGTVAVALADFDVDATSNLTMNENHYLSTATADALVGGDCHVVIIGDSLMNPTSAERLRHGLLTTWQPARWAGISHGTSNNSSGVTAGNLDTGTTFNYPSGPYTFKFGDNVKRDGTGGQSGGFTPAFAQVNYLTGLGCSQFTATGGVGNFFLLKDQTKGSVVVDTQGQPILTGRLQDQGTDTFYNLNGLKTKAVFYADDAMTVDATISDGTVNSVTFTDNSFGTFIATRNPSGAGDVNLMFSFASGITAGDKIGYIDGYSYNPSVSGLSISYMGDGGWNTANHVGGTVVDETGATALSRMTQPNEWYDDVSIQEHLKLFAYKDDALTTLRDKVVILVESQNVQPDTYNYVGQMNLDLLPLKARWEAQADIVDPSGDLKAALQFVVVSLHQPNAPGDHFRHSEYLRQVIGKGGYSDIEFIDMTQEIADTYPGLDPEDFVENGITAIGMPTGTATDPNLTWYTNGDNIHPRSAGSRAMMSAMWDIILRAATPTENITGTVTAEPVFSQVGDAIEFDVESLTGDADRVIVWLDQDGNEVARGNNPVLTNLDPSVTRVDARIITADGGDTTLVGPAIEINNAPAITSQLAIDGGAQPATGDSYDLVITATDANGDDLTYTLSNGTVVGPLTQGSEATFTLTAGAIGVDSVFTCTVTDGNGGSVTSSSVTVTPVSGNSPPTITSYSATPAGPYSVGDNIGINGTTITDPDGDALTYTMTYTLDGAAQGSIDSLAPFNGVVFVNTATGTHVLADPGDYVFTLRVEDPSGAFDEETVSFNVPAPTGPDAEFGTPDYVVFEPSPGSDTQTVTVDNFGLTNEILIRQVLNGARTRLGEFNSSDRAIIGTYLTNNPNAIYALVFSDGSWAYYLENSNHTGDRWPTSGFHDLVGDGWRNSDGTTASGTPYPGGSVELRIYPGT